MDRPVFNTARAPDPAARVVPPFSFRGVSMRVFPLVADMDRLQAFVDGHINHVAPDTVGRFQVSLPYVYLQLVHYPKMSVEAAGGGWIAQNEVNLTIPLAWYARVDGRLVFKDWAYFTPYMLVDSRLSMTTGREIGGWPKALGRVTEGPAAGDVVVSVDAGQDDVLLRVEHGAAPPLWGRTRGVVRSASAWAARSVDILRAGGHLRERSGSTLPNALRMLERLSSFVVGLYATSPYWIALNVKQFRSAARPHLPDYQAFVATRLRIDRVERVRLGDGAGGVRVELHGRRGLAVAEHLGLDVAQTRRDGRGLPVDVLAPVLPFRLDFDMSYPHGEVLAWRTPFTRGWRTGDGAPASGPGEEQGPRLDAIGLVRPEEGEGRRSPDVDLRVLPMFADQRTLQRFCDACLNVTLAGTPYRVEVSEPYAYLLDTDAEAGRSVEIVVPVRWYCDDELRGRAFVPAYAYAGDAAVAASRSEVDGVPTLPAVFSGAPGSSLTVLVEAIAGPGQRAALAPLIEVTSGATGASGATVSRVSREDAQAHRHGSQSQAEPALGPLALPAAITILTLKQFPDAADPTAACYQGLLLGERVPERVSALAELDEPVEIRLHERPGHSLVERLGLQWRAVDVGAPAEVYIVEPCRPFRARMSLRERPARELAVRAGSREWIVPPAATAEQGASA